jgi:hypothetical protein
LTRRRKALWAVLILLTAILVAAYASFPVVVRRLLTGPTLRVLINARPQDFFIDWEEASSPRFGHVVMRNVTLRGSDPNVQWFARIERLELEYSLLALLRRSFQARDVRGSGLSFALRSKLPAGSTIADAAPLPPIPGFSDPPLKSPDDHFFVEPKPWLLDLRNVTIDQFNDIWVNQVRYRGPARVQGGLQLRPLQMVRIDAAAISLDGGQLRIGDSPDGLGLSGSIVVSSRAFEPLRVPLPDLPGVITAELKLDVRADKLQTLGDLFSLPAGVKLVGGAATVAVRGASREGVVDGQVTLTIDGGQARFGDASGNVGFVGSIAVWSKPVQLLKEPKGDLLAALAGDAKLDLRVDKLQALDALIKLPAGSKFEGGGATATVQVAAKEGVADGKLSLAVKKAVVKTKEYRIRGDATVELPVRKWKLAARSYDVSGTRVALSDVYSTGDDPARNWWGTIDVPSGRVGKTISAQPTIRCRDARPLLAMLGVNLPGWTNGLVKLDNFSATANFASAPETLRVTDLDAKGGNFHILGQFAQDGTIGNGAFLVQSGILLLGIEVVPPKPARVRLLLARQWYEKQVKPPAAGGK